MTLKQIMEEMKKSVTCYTEKEILYFLKDIIEILMDA